jgi:hypothetical protein
MDLPTEAGDNGFVVVIIIAESSQSSANACTNNEANIKRILW